MGRGVGRVQGLSPGKAMTALVTLDNARVERDGQVILQGVSLRLNPGEIVTVIGPNGAGKTTLVRVVLGLQSLSDGQVRRSAATRIGYMPQKLVVDRSMPLSVERFLRLTGADHRAAHAALERVGVADVLRRPVAQVSGGELQRVLLARAILRRPDLLVLDEPAQGVDISGQAELYTLIKALRDELGCAVLMVSHDLHLVMAQTDTVLCLNQHVCCHGHPEQVSNDPAYLNLFGHKEAEALAVYHHHHDHHHDLHGDVVETQQ